MTALHLQRVSHARPCAICQQDHGCTYDPRAGIAACMRTESDRPYGAYGWLHSADPTPHEYNARAATSARRAAPLTPTQAAARDTLYQAMRAHRFCRLTPADRAALQHRSLDDLTIKRHGYFSYPDSGQRLDVAGQLEQFARRNALITDWWRLPGTYARERRNGRGSDTYLSGPPAGALAIPVRNVAGQIVALRLRLRNVPKGESRYKWLSGKETPSGSPCHIARPSGAHDPARLIITEGEIKANIASDRLGCIVVAVPGVSIYQDVPAIIDELRQRGDLAADARIIIAYDSDAATNPNVASARDRLANLLAQPPRGEQVTIASWDTRHKGLDDLLVAGGSFTETRYHPKARRGLIDLPFTAPAPVIDYQTLSDAESALHTLAADLLPVRHWDATPGHHVIAATMGVGKTAAILERLHRMLYGLDNGTAWPMVATSKGERPARILYLCDTTDQLREKSERYLHATWREDRLIEEGSITERRWVWRRHEGDRFHIMEGRNRFRQSASFCENPRAPEVGNRRHLAARDVCGNAEHPCPFHERCEIYGYLANKEAVREARLVLATKASYLNGSDEIGDFDCVIFDEDVAAHLLEEITATRDDMSQWRRLLNERDADREYSLLDDCLAWWEAAAAHAAAHATQGRDSLALDALRATAPNKALQLLQAAIGCCFETAKSTPRAICESPRPGGPIPLRAIHDLAQAILTEWGRPAGADSRLRYSAGGALTLRLPRVNALAHLAKKRVIYLDATAHELTMRRLLAWSGQDVPLTFHRFDVAQPVDLITVTDCRFSRDTLTRDDGARLHAIDATLAAMAEAHGIAPAQVAALTFKCVDPTGQDEEADRPLSAFSCGHWGKDDKATDRFAECQILATIGNYTPNIGMLEARHAALRFAETPFHASEGVRRILAYPGTSQGIERDGHPDAEIQEVIDHATWMHETQALGRLRAVRRAEGAFLWVRFNNAPYRDLVSELVTLDELRMRYGLPPLQTESPRLEALRYANEERERQAHRRCALAWLALIRKGTPEGEITLSMLCRESGVRRDAARRWLASQRATTGRSEGSTADESTNSIVIRRTTPAYSPDIGHEPRPAHAPPPVGTYAPVAVSMPRSRRLQQLLDHGYSLSEAERISWQEWRSVS